MRYRLMASYRGASYQAGVGPSDEEVTLFAACPPPERLGFHSSAGHWRKQVSADEIDSLWESRPIGRYRGEPCMVLDDLHDRLHIAYLGRDLHTARRLGFWEVDRGVFEVVVPRQEIDDLREERAEYELAMAEPAEADPRDAGPWAAQGAGARDLMDTGPSWTAAPRAPRDMGPWSARGADAQDLSESGAEPLRGRGGWHTRDTDTGGWEAPDTGAWDAQEVAALARQEPAGRDPQDTAAWDPVSTGEGGRGGGRGDPPGPQRQSGPPGRPRAADLPDAATWNPRPPDAAAVWHGSPAPDDVGPWSALMPADDPAATQRPDTQFAAITSTGPIGEPVIARDSAVTGERAAAAGRAAGGRRAADKAHVTTQSFFSHLCEQASIPQSAYAVGEEIDGAMCLMRTDGGYEVFSSADRARHEVRFFEDEDAAYFYLFGILAAEAVRSGYLRPQAAQPPAGRGPGPQPGPRSPGATSIRPGAISIQPGATSIRPDAISIRPDAISMPPRR
jgi:hypothetical protein